MPSLAPAFGVTPLVRVPPFPKGNYQCSQPGLTVINLLWRSFSLKELPSFNWVGCLFSY